MYYGNDNTYDLSNFNTFTTKPKRTTANIITNTIKSIDYSPMSTTADVKTISVI